MLATLNCFVYLVLWISHRNFRKYYKISYLRKGMVWWLLSKKRFKKELKKIAGSFALRDKEIFKQSEDIKELKAEIVSKKEIDLMIREHLLKVQTGQYTGLHSEPKSEPIKEKHYEKVMIRKAIKTRPEVIKIAIRGLIERDMRTTDIFRIIVEEKKLSGKTQFYHYLSLVRNELRTGLRPELRTKERTRQ